MGYIGQERRSRRGQGRTARKHKLRQGQRGCAVSYIRLECSMFARHQHLAVHTLQAG